MNPVAVPGAIDDLSAVWLDDALRAGGVLAVGVAAIEVEPLGAGVGLLGDLARLRVTYAGDQGNHGAEGGQPGQGPATVIVKLPASDPGGHQVGAMLRAWAREVAFYREVAPASPGARVPACYHTGADEYADDGAGRWVVVLEDCPAVPVDTARGATRTQAEAAVDALATFHAAWWGSERRFAWMPGFDVTGVGGLQPVWEQTHPRFLERYDHVVPAATVGWLARATAGLPRWSQRAATEPLTVVHADYRLDNLLFGPDGGVTMIDWQTALRGPGAMDLTSFLATSLTIDDRRAHEADLIARYLDTLAHALDRPGTAVDAGWFARSYDENLLWWMGQFASNLARLEPEDPAIQAGLDTMIERTFTAALDRDAGRLLG